MFPVTKLISQFHSIRSSNLPLVVLKIESGQQMASSGDLSKASYMATFGEPDYPAISVTN